jgi:hypothetical protein
MQPERSHGMHGLVAVAAAAALLAGCQDPVTRAADVEQPQYAAVSAPAPSPIVNVSVGDEERALWPFTGTDLGADARASDPINMIFRGHADPLSIRAALMTLGGDRTPALPPLPFFQCTWDDAMGGNQTAWAASEGWSGSAIQLECGSYEGLRFHLRLFRVGDWTLGNAHFETIIPGTHDHQVLNWELAANFVAADLARAGVVAAAPQLSNPINPWPFFRTINPLLYWHPQMVPLHPIINAVVLDTQTIGIRSNGQALVLTLGPSGTGSPGHTRQELVIAFNQVIPKPFCGGPADYLYVEGPLKLRQDVTVAGSGLLTREFHASGELTATPINPITGQPLGPSSPARINGVYRGMASAEVHSASSLLTQTLQLHDQPPQRLTVDLQVGPHGVTRSRTREQCD